MRTLDDLGDIKGKLVLVRLDLNVPINDRNEVTDTTRIMASKDTILELREKGARIALLSHFGRPKGNKVSAFSLDFLPPLLEKLWGVPSVSFVDDCLQKPDLQDSGIALMENVRFYQEEEDCDPDFTARICGGAGDIFVNDALSVAHRAHASTEGLAHLLPAYAGRSLAQELKALEIALENPERPLAAIVGGAKVSTKLAVLTHLSDKVDVMILGGGMANTFLYAMGMDIGRSLCEADMKDEALMILDKAQEAGCTILLPVDGKATTEFAENAPYDVVPMTAVPQDRMILDIGEDSAKSICSALEMCKTLIWNGPFGVFEMEPFDQGTQAVARHAAALVKSGDLTVIAGGGDTVAALSKAGVADDMTHILTAGGAFLEWLEGKTLPAIAALDLVDDEDDALTATESR